VKRSRNAIERSDRRIGYVAAAKNIGNTIREKGLPESRPFRVITAIMISATLLRTAAIASLGLVATTFTLPRPAAADAASTAAIAGAAAAIVGGLLYDSNNRPYYERGGRRVYVSRPVEREYNRRHGGGHGGGHGHGHGH
jgi:hypothetical protein